ncbi:28S ribosomal protein S30, mitochondrial [Trichinella zimbabwensis]|uniref:28S ribosomal protein S30, mitochondrial n=1 Tax=Trichinella zimbabwensis TaxID=268475 RepID=A0A0V1HVX6_9BILA|nr:28S ribosomal protein S30, mitochondrial [Trichinella zimbabwensis]
MPKSFNHGFNEQAEHSFYTFWDISSIKCSNEPKSCFSVNMFVDFSVMLRLHGCRMPLLLVHKSRCFSVFNDPEDEHFCKEPVYPKPVTPVNCKTIQAVIRDRKEFAELVKSIPDAPSKIHIVSPVERAWSTAELRWHRPWMKPLIEPRKIYKLACPPAHYNALPFYKYVTKTCTVEGLPKFYDNVEVNDAIKEFKKIFVDNLCVEMNRLQSDIQCTQGSSVGIRDMASQRFLDQLIHASILLFSPSRIYLANAQVYFFNTGAGRLNESFKHEKLQVDRDTPCEAFWIRSGFSSKETDEEADMENIYGKGAGNVAFCYREKVCTQIRTTYPLSAFISSDDPLCLSSIDKFAVDPQLIGMQSDSRHLRMVPGFEYGDDQEFGLVTTRTFGDVYSKMIQWEAEQEELHECLISLGIATNFAWLTSQAHYLGFNQYNDITYPMVAQTIVTDLRMWYFFAYQLNTLRLMDPWDESILPNNVCWYQGPVKLFDDFDGSVFTNFNEEVISLCLKFLLNKPDECTETNLRPYLTKRPAYTSIYKDSFKYRSEKLFYLPVEPNPAAPRSVLSSDSFTNQLSNSITTFHVEILVAKIEYNYSNIAPVICVYHARADVDSVLQSQARSRCNTTIAADRNSNLNVTLYKSNPAADCEPLEGAVAYWLSFANLSVSVELFILSGTKD